MQPIADLLNQAYWKLNEADQNLERCDQSWAFYREIELIEEAIEKIQAALKLLDELKEETCEEP